MLSTELFADLRPEFFRVLAGPSARVYIDVLDALEMEASQRSAGLPRDEAIALTVEMLESHPLVDLSDLTETQGLAELPLREKARLILDRFAATGWIEDQPQANYERTLFLTSGAGLMIATLRRIARPDATVFSDKLVHACGTLMSPTAIEEDPWPQTEACLNDVRVGLLELRAMQESIERFTRRQLATQTLRDNLQVLYDEYAARVGRTCYTELIRAKLPTRLSVARQRVGEFSFRPDLLDRMQQEVMRRDSSASAETAASRVRNTLDELQRNLEMVIPLAEMIDRRTAEFTRRSLARFRYLQEVVSERRGQVQALFEWVNQRFEGQRFMDLPEADDFPAPRLFDAKLLRGLDSFYLPRISRALDEIEAVDDDVSEESRAHSLREMEASLRDSLTVARANRFVAALPGERGARLESANLPLRNEDDLADMISCLLHADSAGARYEIEVPRIQHDTETPEFDAHSQYQVERFVVIKK